MREVEVALEDKITRLKAKNDNSQKKLNDYIKKYFVNQHGVSASYRDCIPLYSQEDQTLMLEREGVDYPISNIGSKSNYMFLHLCYFYGIHDLFLHHEETNVLPFLFIDQPSIPYYADRHADQTLGGEDRTKLQEAFRLTDKFMSNLIEDNHEFQIIMVEHADPTYWEELETFETRAFFTENDGLIPEYARR